jgi:hypothetical protein
MRAGDSRDRPALRRRAGRISDPLALTLPKDYFE